MINKRHKINLLSLIAFMAMLIVGSPVWAQQQSPATTTLTTAQVEQLVAPIALYPDDLLTQVLMASTYPLEVVEAARWSRDNPKVTGKALEDAMQKQAWDPSVKALTAVPQTLQMMNDQLKWTQDLGDAFLAQQTDVLDAVQRLRARADAAGNLKSTSQQTVRRVNRPANVSAASGAPATAYEIVPTTPDEYYVPIYDPTVVYGAWPYPDYLPYYWYPPGWGGGWFGFGAGVLAGAAIWGGVNWWNRNVHVDHHRFNQFNRTNITDRNWSHNVDHRRGVPYNNPQVANRFGDQGRGKARDQARQKIAQGGNGTRRHGTRRQWARDKAAWAKAEWAKAEWAAKEWAVAWLAAWAKAAWAAKEWAPAWLAEWARAAWHKAAWLEWPAAWLAAWLEAWRAWPAAACMVVVEWASAVAEAATAAEDEASAAAEEDEVSAAVVDAVVVAGAVVAAAGDPTSN